MKHVKLFIVSSLKDGYCLDVYDGSPSLFHLPLFVLTCVFLQLPYLT